MNVQFFRSWAGYSIPVQPDLPIEYEETRDLPAVYRGTFDERGNLLSFVKRRKIRSVGPAYELPTTMDAGTRIFLKVEGQEGERRPGEQIEFKDTWDLHSYYDGIVGADGRTVQLEFVNYLVAMTDDYEYVDGKLVGRTVRNSDGRSSRMKFEGGRPIIVK